jgi:hypothetical protein
MKTDKHQGKPAPETGLERTTTTPETAVFREESSFFATEQTSVSASGVMTNQEAYGAVEYTTGRDEARGNGARQRHQGDLSESQLRLLRHLERLTYSLHGPEESLDRHSYNRPFPPAIRIDRM